MNTAQIIWTVCRSICRCGFGSLADAHHDDPAVKFNRPFLAGVLAFSLEEAFNWMSGMFPSPRPSAFCSHDARKSKNQEISYFKRVNEFTPLSSTRKLYKAISKLL